MNALAYQYEPLTVTGDDARKVIEELRDTHRQKVSEEMRRFMRECAATSKNIARKGVSR